MAAYLRALRTDPQFAACVATILLLLTDDVPEWAYGTFRDPGCALLLSLIYGNCFGLLVARRDVRATTRRWLAGLLLAALPAKYFLQTELYVRNAAIIDAALLLAAHAWIAVEASPDGRFRSTLVRVAAGSVALISSILLSFAGVYHLVHKLEFEREFYALAAVRAVAPYAFWTAVLSVRRHNSPLPG